MQFIFLYLRLILICYILNLSVIYLCKKCLCLMWYLRLALDKIQAISFKVVKACYPFTIKGWLFSLLCCQPEAVPVYLKTLTPLITLRCQYLPLIWNGQAKAQPPNRFILSLTKTVNRKTRNVTEKRTSPGSHQQYSYQLNIYDLIINTLLLMVHLFNEIKVD